MDIKDLMILPEEPAEACFYEVSMDISFMDAIFRDGESATRDQNKYWSRISEKEKKQIFKEIKLAWSELTYCQNECLSLWIKGNSEKRIAETIGRHQTTVSQHIRYAIKKLKKHIIVKSPEGKRLLSSSPAIWHEE